jgi:hypothetical protein
MTHCTCRSRARAGHPTATGPVTSTCSHDRRGRAEATRTALGEALVMRRRTRVRFPPPPPTHHPTRGLRTSCGALRRTTNRPGPQGPGRSCCRAVISRPDVGVTGSYQELPTPPAPPPGTSPGEDPRRVPERGAGAFPAPPADPVVQSRGLLAVRMPLDVGVESEPAPQWLPSHGPTLGVADSAEKGRTDRRAGSAPLVPGADVAADGCTSPTPFVEADGPTSPFSDRRRPH